MYFRNASLCRVPIAHFEAVSWQSLPEGELPPKQMGPFAPVDRGIRFASSCWVLAVIFTFWACHRSESNVFSESPFSARTKNRHAEDRRIGCVPASMSCGKCSGWFKVAPKLNQDLVAVEVDPSNELCREEDTQVRTRSGIGVLPSGRL